MNRRAALVLLLVAALGTLAALYQWLRPQPQPAAPATASATGSGPPLVSVREFQFEVAQGQVRGPTSMTVQEGERVSLRVRSDQADELHVHGYDLSAELAAGEIVTLTFIAGRAGRFEIELHHAGRELGALEVQPR